MDSASSSTSDLSFTTELPLNNHTQPRWKYQNGIGGRIRRAFRMNRKCISIALAIIIILSIAFLTWLSLVLTLISRLKPPPMHNGLQTLLSKWHIPSDSMSLLEPFPDDFMRGINPLPLHSHNDYDRRVPLFDALATGCTGVEADIWLRTRSGKPEDVELLVGHSARSLRPDRTLQSLYTSPLLKILRQHNMETSDSDSSPEAPIGIYPTHPNTTLVLLIDLKSTSTPEIWSAINVHLEPLRKANYLSSYNSSNSHNPLTIRPITVVGTGKTRFSDILNNSTATYRDIFFDAPLSHLTHPDSPYNSTNSYYASDNMSATIGRPWFGKFSEKQLDSIEEQIAAAKEKGLKARYWGAVTWPIGWRDYVWDTLAQRGVGMLNVDALIEAARWNWGVCVVAGLVLCGY